MSTGDICKILDCVEGGAGTCRNAEMIEDLQQKLTDAININTKMARELITLRANNGRMTAKLDHARKFHPRAMKLIEKEKNFVVVACDEPYFNDVYFRVKIQEMANGSWTDEDEKKYREMVYDSQQEQSHERNRTARD
jgi:hypothetical protein